MLKRFDHAVIGVRDLDRAMAVFGRLGFDVQPGGRHTGRGTYNAIVRFGLDYLELISIYDRSELAGTGLRGDVLAEFLDRHEGGLVGYCLAADDLERVAERARAAGLDAREPFAMERLRPDGRLLRWRLIVPGGVSWRRPWPFLIEWEAPDEERLSWERPGQHASGVQGVAGVTVAVRDLAAAEQLYGQQLGLPVRRSGAVDALEAEGAHVELGSLAIDLLAPRSPGVGPIARELDEAGEGLYQVRLRVADLAATERFFSSRGIRARADGWPSGLHLDPAEALGARLVFVAAPS